MLRLLLVSTVLVGCWSQSFTFGGARRSVSPKFGQQTTDVNTAVRIGLVGSVLGNLNPVPGSDYPSRIANNNRNPSPNHQAGGASSAGHFQPSYQPVPVDQIQPTHQGGSSQNLRQVNNVYNGGQSPGRAPQGECYCANINECNYDGGFDGAGLIDIRIVNNRPTVNSQPQCDSRYQELCCPLGGGGGTSGGTSGTGTSAGLVQPTYSSCPAGAARQCGLRSPIPVPGYSSKPAEASFGAYPWVATILREGDAYVSSGVLIDSQWVLTVAHHINKYRNNYGSIKIRFGEWDASDPNHEPCAHEERTVIQMHVHPNFNPSNLHNDVALLRLSQPLNLYNTPHINTACLPSYGQSFNYQTCWVAGFGKDAFGSQGKYSFIQKEVDVPVVAHDSCQAQLRQTRLGYNFNLDGKSFICAGGEAGKDSCEGDGGAPLACETNGQWTVAGLVAWGVGCAEADRPGVYVNVASFADWIRGKTAGYAV